MIFIKSCKVLRLIVNISSEGILNGHCQILKFIFTYRLFQTECPLGKCSHTKLNIYDGRYFVCFAVPHTGSVFFSFFFLVYEPFIYSFKSSLLFGKNKKKLFIKMKIYSQACRQRMFASMLNIHFKPNIYFTRYLTFEKLSIIRSLSMAIKNRLSVKSFSRFFFLLLLVTFFTELVYMFYTFS